MNWKKEIIPLVLITAVFLAAFYIPINDDLQGNPVIESFLLLKAYAKEHVILCLIPAFFIAGAISVFISQASVITYLGAKANKIVAYSVASVSGSILAVCSCTVLPLFAGIYKMGAGIGPASTFLYSGPAINVLAIILTARILGIEMGIARAVGAVVFSLVIGLLMQLIFKKDKTEKSRVKTAVTIPDNGGSLAMNILFFASMIGILVFANWGEPGDEDGIFHVVYSGKWIITSIFAIALALILAFRRSLKTIYLIISALLVALLALIFPDTPLYAFAAGILALSIITSTDKKEGGEWITASWGFAKQMLPLLFIGVLLAGLLLGRPGSEGLIPSNWINAAVGGNSVTSNFFASLAGAFMYFATLTEVPILQGLMGAGMGKGPALALLLAGPALSLPNMLVIRSVMGTGKTAVYVLLVCFMATLSGVIFGSFF